MVLLSRNETESKTMDTKEKIASMTLAKASSSTNLSSRRPTLAAFFRRKTLKAEPIYEEKPDYYVKVCLLGDAGSGKTTLVKEFSCSARTAVYQRRVSDTRNKSLEYIDRIVSAGDKSVLLRAYDTAGQEKFRSLTASYYRGAHGCLVLFDVTKENTFNNLTYWLHDLKEYSSNPEISTILVGTKCHVPSEERAVSRDRAEKFAESVGLKYMEVSAEEGTNVTEVFETLADLIIDSLSKDHSGITQQPNKVILQRDQQNTKKKVWCSC